MHKNGELIYTPELFGGTAADIRESDLATGLWPFLSGDREGAWNIVVEGLAGGANPKRVRELAEIWGCDDVDAQHYADRVGIALTRDGNVWCSHRADFINLQESPAGFGDTCLEAMAELAKALGYKPSKMWGAKFSDLATSNVKETDHGQ